MDAASGCSTYWMTSTARDWRWRSTSPCLRRASSAAWNRSFNGAQSPAPYAATMGPSTSAERCKHGPSGKTLRCSTSRQAILSRTPTSSATTGPCVTLSLPAICSMTSNRSRTSPLVGYGLTTTSAETWRSVAPRQCRSLHWQRSTTFGDR